MPLSQLFFFIEHVRVLRNSYKMYDIPFGGWPQSSTGAIAFGQTSGHTGQQGRAPAQAVSCRAPGTLINRHPAPAPPARPPVIGHQTWFPLIVPLLCLLMEQVHTSPVVPLLKNWQSLANRGCLSFEADSKPSRCVVINASVIMGCERNTHKTGRRRKPAEE